ncbi:MAG: sulfotransferase domain-containing protein [Acidothermus sp.]|nr:sulfotransferase domain-containing protein [Acidothermus sp.]
MPLPDFLIIGAPKAGTTALYAALRAHPEIFMSPVKEPRFFLCDPDTPPPRRGGPGDAQTYQEYVWRRGDYEALFAAAPPGSVKGEASPFYLWDRAAHRRIRQLIPHAKLIAVLRDPIERAYSNWAHLYSAGLETHDLLTACEQEPARVRAGWAPFWRYVELGRYGEQLRDLYRVFPRQQVLVLRYRDLRERPADVLDDIARFLGVRTGTICEIPVENVRPHPPENRRARALTAVLRMGSRIGHLFPPRLRELARTPLLGALHREAGPRPPLTAAQRAVLLRYFEADIALLEEVTGQSFESWRTANAGSEGALLATIPR